MRTERFPRPVSPRQPELADTELRHRAELHADTELADTELADTVLADHDWRPLAERLVGGQQRSRGAVAGVTS